MTAKKLKPNESMRAAYLNNMVKISSQESPLMGSIHLNDVSPKRTDEYPSNDNQDEGAKNTQSSIVDCDTSTIPTGQEDGNVDLWMGGKGTDNRNSNPPHIDLWNTPLIRVRKDNENTKWNTSGWPSWETTSKKSIEGDSSMACKRGGNKFEDGKAKRETSEGIGVFDRDRVQGWGQSNISNHMVDKGSLSKSCWNRGKDGSEKKKVVGWPSWDGARSKNSSKSEYSNTKSGTRECDSFNRDGIDGWRQHKSKINMMEKGSLKKSVHWNRSKDGHAKKENVGWSSWDGAWSKPIEQYTGHQIGGGWNQSRGSVVLEEDTTLKGKGGWHESEDGSGKKESGGWPSWDGARSKTIGNSGWKQSQGWRGSEEDTTMACKRGWTDSEDVKAKRKASEGGDDAFYLGGVDRCQQSNMVDKGSSSNSCWEKKEDGKGNKEIDGWRSWGGSMSKTIKDSPRSQNKSTGWSRSLAWTDSDHGDFRKEDSSRNSGLDQSEDPWMQQSTAIPLKCDWNKSVGWTSSKGDGFDRNRWKQSPGLDQTGGDPWKQHCPIKSPKDCEEKSGSWAAPGKSCFRKKHEWSGARRFCNPDASEQHGSRLGPGSDQSARDPWKKQLYPSGLPKSKSLNLNKGKSSFRDEVNWSIAPNFGDPDIPNKQKRSTFLPKFGGKRPFSGRNMITASSSKHGSYQSNDRYREEADVSANYRDSPRGASKRGHGIGDTLRQYSDRDMDGFRESNKAHSPRHESYGHGAGKNNFSRMDTSYDGCNHENTGKVSTWNGTKIHSSTARDELRQSHTMIGDCLKSMADHDAHNSHHVWKTQQNYNMSQQTPQNTLSPSDIQNDGFADSAIQFAQNVQVNSQLPPSPKSSNPNGQIQDHEQPAMSNYKLVKENDDIPCQPLNFFPSTAISSSDPVGAASVQDNEGSSSTNLPSRSRSSPVSINASKTSEELKASTNELTPSERNLSTSTCSAKKLQSGSCDPCHREPLDDKGTRMFKFALAEFVKKILKPTWKEGGLSLEAHRTVVKKVVGKVIRVLGSNVPRTQEMIDHYMSFANDKLNKLTQDYLEMYINT